MKKPKVNVTESEPEERKGNCSICGAEALMEGGKTGLGLESKWCVCDKCLKEKGDHLIICKYCFRVVGATEDEEEEEEIKKSGRYKGLVLVKGRVVDFWAHEECIEKVREIKKKEWHASLPTHESYNEDIKNEEEQERKEPLKYYSERVLGIRLVRDIPFDEYYHNAVEWSSPMEVETKRLLDEITDPFMHEKPEGMTKKEWIIQKRRRRKEEREKRLQNERDHDLRFHHTPQKHLIDNIETVECRCEDPEMRQGKFCNSCELLTRVNEYLMRLFKDTAEAIK